MKKLLFFVDKISSSGASKIISWLANNIDIVDTEISLTTYLPMKDQRDIKDSVKRINLSIQSENRIKRSIIVIRKLREIFKKEKIDVCVAFLPMESMYAIFAAFGTKTRVVVCERSDPYFERSTVVDIARRMFVLASGAVFQTEKAKEYFSQSLQRKSVVIHNPAFENKDIQYIPYRKRPMEISYSGRLYIKQKRQDILLHAFKKVVDDGYRVELLIYGDGIDGEKLQNLTRQLGITELVHFKGNINNVEVQISHSRMLVLSSDYEGIPNVIIEALQCGVPVVSTDCSPGGARLLIEEGVNGFIVPREDYIALAEKIEELLDDELRAESMSVAAVDITKRFSESSVLEKWRNYLEKLLNG